MMGLLKSVAVLTVMLGGLGLGSWWARSHQTTSELVPVSIAIKKNHAIVGRETVNVDFSLFWTVWQQARLAHVDQAVTTTELIYGAINGMLQMGFDDPYSSFFEPKMSEVVSRNLTGNYSGIGAQLEIQDDVLTIIAPLAESPAELAGLLAGDRILAIDGISTQGTTVLDAVATLRGDTGSTVTLQIERQAETDVETFEVTLTRATIDLPSVRREEITPGFVYLRVTDFAEDTGEEWQARVSEIDPTTTAGIVLDLRNNAGGVVDPVTTVLGDFIESGVATKFVYSVGQPKSFEIKGTGKLINIPLTVLINRGTASAAEMVAGALQDYGRGTLIGETSFGKGVIQQVFEMEVPGVAGVATVRIVTARWYTPKGRNVTDTGLTPEVEVSLTNPMGSGLDDPAVKAAVDSFGER